MWHSQIFSLSGVSTPSASFHLQFGENATSCCVVSTQVTLLQTKMRITFIYLASSTCISPHRRTLFELSVCSMPGGVLKVSVMSSFSVSSRRTSSRPSPS